MRSPGTESITHSVKSADATSIFGAAGARLSTLQPLQVHHFGGGVFKMDTYKKEQIYSQVENASHFFAPIERRSLKSATLSNRAQYSQHSP